MKTKEIEKKQKQIDLSRAFRTVFGVDGKRSNEQALVWETMKKMLYSESECVQGSRTVSGAVDPYLIAQKADRKDIFQSIQTKIK